MAGPSRSVACRSTRVFSKLWCERLEDRSLFDTGLSGLVRERLFGSNHAPLQTADGARYFETQPELGNPDAKRSEPRRVGGAMSGSVLTSWLGEERYVMPGSWVVHVGGLTGTPAAQRVALEANLSRSATGMTVSNTLGQDGWFQITAPTRYTAGVVSAALGRLAPILSVQPEFADYSAFTIPNDPYFRYQDSLHNTGANGWLPEADIDAPEAWGHTGPNRGSTGVVVAVNDTGVDYAHPDLYRNIWLNQSEIPSSVTAVDTDGDGLITFWDLNNPANEGVVSDLNGTGYIDAGDLLFPMVDGGWADGIDGGANGYTDDLIGWDFAHNDNDPYDDNAHGTHVAGTIGATGNDGVGVAGVVWKSQIMVAEGLDENGFGTDFDLAAAINYAVANGARATNASWGGPYSDLIDSAIADAGAADHLVVAAAGNDFNDNDLFPDYSFPASLPYDNILSVGSTDPNDFPSWFTNYGATSVDLMAPGDPILSTVPQWWYGDYASAYEYFGGTSMSAPHVAGAAALLWATDPSASLADIRAAILGGVDLLPELDPLTGITPVASGGRLNLLGGLRQLHANDLFVLATTPGDGETVTGPQPTAYTVTFNSPVQISGNPADLQASDFSVNGVPATGVTLSPDGLTATFTYSTPPLTTEGRMSMRLAPGSVRRIDTNGTIAAGYEGTFRYDSVPLAVTGTDPTPGSVFTLGGPYTFRMYFNEAFDPDSLRDFEPILWDVAHGFGYSGIVTPVFGNTALDVTFIPPLPVTVEGNLLLQFSANALSDVFGNPNADFFEATFTTDIVTRPYPVPFGANAPLGSLLATGSPQIGLMNPGVPGGDRDDFTLNIDAGQALTVQVLNPAPGLRSRVQVYNAANVLVGSADAPAAGQRAILQSVQVTTGGLYTIRVSGVGGTTGTYSVQATLNANLEVEGRVSGVTNNTPATAQTLDSSFIGLSTDLAKASRGAVFGVADGTLQFAAARVAYTFEEITATGTHVLANSDAAATSISIPFAFNFYGTNYTTVGFSSNGLITFGGLDASFSNSNLATNPALAAIAPLWDDLFTGSNGVVWQVLGSPGSRRLVIEWDNAQYYLDGAFTLKFEAVLFEGSNTIQFNYQNLSNGGFGSEGASATVGVKGANPNANPLLVSFNTAGGLVGSGKSILLTTVAPVINYDYYSFTAKAGERVGLAIVGGTGVELLAPNGTTVLGTGIGGASNVTLAVSGVTVGADGTYFARVRGEAGTGYSLVLTRDVVFGLEQNNSAATAQPLAGAEGALGYIEPTPVVSAVDSGWYDWNGFHSPTNTNYFAGQANDGVNPIRQLRDWFVFNVPSVGGTITSVRLELFLPGLVSPDPSETFELFDVTTPVSTLVAGGSGLTAIYNDLGTGVSYGSVTISAADNGRLVVINLNTAGIAAVTAAQGGQFAIGGAVTTLAGTANQSVFGGTGAGETRQLVIVSSPPSDWYSVTLTGDQTSLQVETRTPGDGAGEIRNLLNPRIEVYNANGTTLIASGVALVDGRNEKILLTGLTPGATYQVRVYGEAGTVGEYFVSATPLRVPTITTRVDDGYSVSAGPDGVFKAPTLPGYGWTNVTGAGWQNDYTVHHYGQNQTEFNYAVWTIRVTSSNPELFTTWVPRPTNATNATYEIYRGITLLGTVVVNQRDLPNDGLLFGNTFVESLGTFSGIPVNSMLTVRLLTQGANGDVVADGVFDPPTGAEVVFVDTGVAVRSRESKTTIEPGSAARQQPVWAFGVSIAWSGSIELWQPGSSKSRREIRTADDRRYQEVRLLPDAPVASHPADHRGELVGAISSVAAPPVEDPLFRFETWFDECIRI